MLRSTARKGAQPLFGSVWVFTMGKVFRLISPPPPWWMECLRVHIPCWTYFPAERIIAEFQCEFCEARWCSAWWYFKIDTRSTSHGYYFPGNFGSGRTPRARCWWKVKFEQTLFTRLLRGWCVFQRKKKWEMLIMGTFFCGNFKWGLLCLHFFFGCEKESRPSISTWAFKIKKL